MSAQLRDQTPPPRRRAHAEQDRAVQQQTWSAKPGSEVKSHTPLTSSPLPRPKEAFDMNDLKEKGLLSPQANIGESRDCLLPLKVNEDVCFSSPKPARGGGNDLGEVGLFLSPGQGKENWQPAQGYRGTPHTPMKTPSRLPTVQENDGLGAMPPLNEQPAWVVRSPEPASSPQEELGRAMKGLGLSPVPPGLEDVHCELPKPTVKSTFIQFVSPLKTFSVMSPPKTEPMNFAPSTLAYPCDLFGSLNDHLDGGTYQATSDSPSPWFTHEQIPFFPDRPNYAAPMPGAPAAAAAEQTSQGAETRQKGPVVRLADFLPEDSASSAGMASLCQPLDPASFFGSTEGFCFNAPGMSMAPAMPGSETGWECTTTSVDQQAMQAQQWQPMQQQLMQSCPPQLPTEQVQLQDLQMQSQQSQQSQQQQQQQHQQAADQVSLQQMQAQLQQMQMQQQLQQQLQMQQQMQQLQQGPQLVQAPQAQPQMTTMQMPQQPQMQSPQVQQSQMQPPQMQPPQMQPPQMQPPQMQPPQMQPPQMQPPQMPQQMQPDNFFLQQMMQMQMQPQMQLQPPCWPPMQPPNSMAGEQVPAPPPQTAMELAAPSVLCPSACHQAQVCRCGEGKASEAASGNTGASQDSAAPNTCILLSAAMFPEMGTNSGVTMGNAGRQSL